MNPATAEFYELLGFTLVQGYGMSENGPLISTNTIRYHDNRSVGLPVKYTRVKIDSPDAQGVGEILVRSPSIMKGYFGNPEATREIMTAGGYLRTGNLGRFDRRGQERVPRGDRAPLQRGPGYCGSPGSGAQAA